MAGSPPRKADLWHIGMAHGLYMDDPECDRSSLITPQEIADSGFDYLALGHVHVHRQMRHGDTLACYPGVPAACYGTVQSGYMALVELTPGAGARAIARELTPCVARRASRRMGQEGTRRQASRGRPM
jgi:DNA repair exonuclease SbcCD nuclease subunit